MTGDLAPGRVSKLMFTVSEDGRPVGDVDPYRGAAGHQVAIRAGGLPYPHAHPENGTTAGGATYAVSAPSGGDYHLSPGFKHEGTVHTACLHGSDGGGGAGPLTPRRERREW
ncbi:hypothetical protein [Microbispora sp. NPDC046933]|uniref:hypothetical protein n=1 Tax=Microbispora sp. NPDC046933 TaxID=3155618 RepID=UPI003403F4CA